MEYMPTELCQSCQGACCKHMPGSYYPQDFKGRLSEIVKMLFEGKCALDWWEGDPLENGRERTYYVRPAIKGANKVFDPSWGGECVFLTTEGCLLPFEKRPYECRALEPKEGECDKHGVSKKSASIEWYPYQTALRRIGEYVVERSKEI